MDFRQLVADYVCKPLSEAFAAGAVDVQLPASAVPAGLPAALATDAAISTLLSDLRAELSVAAAWTAK